MSLLIMKDRYLMVEREPQFFIEDREFMALLKNEKDRVELLKAFGANIICVGAIGKSTSSASYQVKRINKEDVKTLAYEKEVGYFAKLG